MKRDEAIHELRAARKELQETMSGLSEEDFVRPKAIVKWTLQDLLSHIAAWDEEMVRVLQAFSLASEPTFTYTISERNEYGAWNEEQVASRRGRAVEESLAEFESARRDLVQVIEGLTDPVLSRTRMTSWGVPATGFELIGGQAEHDREHAAQVRSYRKKIERWARARQKRTASRKASGSRG